MPARSTENPTESRMAKPLHTYEKSPIATRSIAQVKLNRITHHGRKCLLLRDKRVGQASNANGERLAGFSYPRESHGHHSGARRHKTKRQCMALLSHLAKLDQQRLDIDL